MAKGMDESTRSAKRKRASEQSFTRETSEDGWLRRSTRRSGHSRRDTEHQQKADDEWEGKIIDRRVSKKGPEYLIKWEDVPITGKQWRPSWEPERNVDPEDAEAFIRAQEAEQASREAETSQGSTQEDGQETESEGDTTTATTQFSDLVAPRHGRSVPEVTVSVPAVSRLPKKRIVSSSSTALVNDSEGSDPIEESEVEFAAETASEYIPSTMSAGTQRPSQSQNGLSHQSQTTALANIPEAIGMENLPAHVRTDRRMTTAPTARTIPDSIPDSQSGPDTSLTTTDSSQSVGRRDFAVVPDSAVKPNDVISSTAGTVEAAPKNAQEIATSQSNTSKHGAVAAGPSSGIPASRASKEQPLRSLLPSGPTSTMAASSQASTSSSQKSSALASQPAPQTQHQPSPSTFNSRPSGSLGPAPSTLPAVETNHFAAHPPRPSTPSSQGMGSLPAPSQQYLSQPTPASVPQRSPYTFEPTKRNNYSSLRSTLTPHDTSKAQAGTAASFLNPPLVQRSETLVPHDTQPTRPSSSSRTSQTPSQHSHSRPSLSAPLTSSNVQVDETQSNGLLRPERRHYYVLLPFSETAETMYQGVVRWHKAKLSTVSTETDPRTIAKLYRDCYFELLAHCQGAGLYSNMPATQVISSNTQADWDATSDPKLRFIRDLSAAFNEVNPGSHIAINATPLSAIDRTQAFLQAQAIPHHRLRDGQESCPPNTLVMLGPPSAWRARSKGPLPAIMITVSEEHPHWGHESNRSMVQAHSVPVFSLVLPDSIEHLLLVHGKIVDNDVEIKNIVEMAFACSESVSASSRSVPPQDLSGAARALANMVLVDHRVQEIPGVVVKDLPVPVQGDRSTTNSHKRPIVGQSSSSAGKRRRLMSPENEELDSPDLLAADDISMAERSPGSSSREAELIEIIHKLNDKLDLPNTQTEALAESLRAEKHKVEELQAKLAKAEERIGLLSRPTALADVVEGMDIAQTHYEEQRDDYRSVRLNVEKLETQLTETETRLTARIEKLKGEGAGMRDERKTLREELAAERRRTSFEVSESNLLELQSLREKNVPALERKIQRLSEDMNMWMDRYRTATVAADEQRGMLEALNQELEVYKDKAAETIAANEIKRHADEMRAAKAQVEEYRLALEDSEPLKRIERLREEVYCLQAELTKAKRATSKSTKGASSRTTLASSSRPSTPLPPSPGPATSRASTPLAQASPRPAPVTPPPQTHIAGRRGGPADGPGFARGDKPHSKPSSPAPSPTSPMIFGSRRTRTPASQHSQEVQKLRKKVNDSATYIERQRQSGMHISSLQQQSLQRLRDRLARAEQGENGTAASHQSTATAPKTEVPETSATRDVVEISD